MKIKKLLVKVSLLVACAGVMVITNNNVSYAMNDVSTRELRESKINKLKNLHAVLKESENTDAPQREAVKKIKQDKDLLEAFESVKEAIFEYAKSHESEFSISEISYLLDLKDDPNDSNGEYGLSYVYEVVEEEIEKLEKELSEQSNVSAAHSGESVGFSSFSSPNLTNDQVDGSSLFGSNSSSNMNSTNNNMSGNKNMFSFSPNGGAAATEGQRQNKRVKFDMKKNEKFTYSNDAQHGGLDSVEPEFWTKEEIREKIRNIFKDKDYNYDNEYVDFHTFLDELIKSKTKKLRNGFDDSSLYAAKFDVTTMWNAELKKSVEEHVKEFVFDLIRQHPNYDFYDVAYLVNEKFDVVKRKYFDIPFFSPSEYDQNIRNFVDDARKEFGDEAYSFGVNSGQIGQNFNGQLDGAIYNLSKKCRGKIVDYVYTYDLRSPQGTLVAGPVSRQLIKELKQRVDKEGYFSESDKSEIVRNVLINCGLEGYNEYYDVDERSLENKSESDIKDYLREKIQNTANLNIYQVLEEASEKFQDVSFGDITLIYDNEFASQYNLSKFSQKEWDEYQLNKTMNDETQSSEEVEEDDNKKEDEKKETTKTSTSKSESKEKNKKIGFEKLSVDEEVQIKKRSKTTDALSEKEKFSLLSRQQKKELSEVLEHEGKFVKVAGFSEGEVLEVLGVKLTVGSDGSLYTDDEERLVEENGVIRLETEDGVRKLSEKALMSSLMKNQEKVMRRAEKVETEIADGRQIRKLKITEASRYYNINTDVEVEGTKFKINTLGYLVYVSEGKEKFVDYDEKKKTGTIIDEDGEELTVDVYKVILNKLKKDVRIKDKKEKQDEVKEEYFEGNLLLDDLNENEAGEEKIRLSDAQSVFEENIKLSVNQLKNIIELLGYVNDENINNYLEMASSNEGDNAVRVGNLEFAAKMLTNQVEDESFIDEFADEIDETEIEEVQDNIKEGINDVLSKFAESEEEGESTAAGIKKVISDVMSDEGEDAVTEELDEETKRECVEEFKQQKLLYKLKLKSFGKSLGKDKFDDEDEMNEDDEDETAYGDDEDENETIEDENEDEAIEDENEDEAIEDED